MGPLTMRRLLDTRQADQMEGLLREQTDWWTTRRAVTGRGRTDGLLRWGNAAGRLRSGVGLGPRSGTARHGMLGVGPGTGQGRGREVGIQWKGGGGTEASRWAGMVAELVGRGGARRRGAGRRGTQGVDASSQRRCLAAAAAAAVARSPGAAVAAAPAVAAAAAAATLAARATADHVMCACALPLCIVVAQWMHLVHPGCCLAGILSDVGETCALTMELP